MEGFVTYQGCSGQTIGYIIALLGLLFVSASVSASEVAYFSLSPADLRRIRERKSLAAESVVKLLAMPEQLLATILVINNLVNICIVILSAKIVGSMFAFVRFEFLVTGVGVTFLLLLFGEILPKVFAQGSNVGVALFYSQPLLLLRYLCYPLSYLLIRTGNRIGDMAAHNSDISIEELADAVDMTTASSAEEQKMLSGIVNFASRDVAEIMRSRVDIVAVEHTMTFGEVKKIIIESGYSRLPVYDDDLDHIKGTLFVKDLLPHISREEFGWQQLIRQSYFAPLHKKINSLLDDFQRSKNHMAIVVDEYGATQGLVTLEDILEEVVGEISDESDTDESFYKRLNENTYLFEGKTHIVDMTRVLALDDETFDDVQGRAETVAGLMLELRRGFLKKGDEVEAHGVTFAVQALEGHRIDKVKIVVHSHHDKES